MKSDRWLVIKSVSIMLGFHIQVEHGAVGDRHFLTARENVFYALGSFSNEAGNT